MTSRLRLTGIGVALAMMTFACANDHPPANSDAGPSTGSTATADPSTSTTSLATTAATSVSFAVAKIEPSPRKHGPEALIPSDFVDVPSEIRFTDPGFGPPLVQSGDLKSGGPAPDAIPSINTPRFEHVTDVRYLKDREPVFVLELGGEARAYPLQIMVWHEIVNDSVAGIPIAITYCPLCNSAFAFALYNSSLVMFDRQTFSLWSHFTGQGLLGVFGSDQLASYSVTLASWAEFKAAHPDGIVLSRDTGFGKDYGRNPYPGYDDIATPPFLYDGPVDGRYPAKTRLVGLDLDNGAQAITNQPLERDRVVTLTNGHTPLVVWWQPGTGSALDAKTVPDGRDIGTTGAFHATIDGQALTFTAIEGGFRDTQTASTWNVFGHATNGPLTGRDLTRITHVDTFWFAWAAFKPDTSITG